MIAITYAELQRILFLYRMGVAETEIIAAINEDRKADEELKSSDINYYIQCVFRGAS